MLSLFPQFFDWSWFVPFVFRIFLALYLLQIGTRFMKNRKDEESQEMAWIILATMILSLGLMLFFGVYVQLVGVIGFSLSLFAIWLTKKYPTIAPESKTFYLLLGLVSLSLLFLGAGPFAFDLPL